MIRNGIWGVFPFPDPQNQDKIGISFSISPYFFWITWKYIPKSSRRFLRKRNMWLRTWYGQECTWWSLYQLILFIKDWKRCRLQQPDLMCMLPQWLHLSPITMMICRILLKPFEESQTQYLSWVNIADCCLDSARAFNTDQFGYITYIFEDTSYSIFHTWETKN